MKRNLSILLLSSGALLLTNPAHAQDEADSSAGGIFSGWTANIDFDLSPRIGEALPSSDDSELIDESEGSVSLAFSRGERLKRLQFKVGASTAPQLIGGGDPESGFFAEATVGDAYIPFDQLIGSDREIDPSLADAWRPYARYRFGSSYTNFFDSHVRDLHTVTAGIRYRDVRTIVEERAIKLQDFTQVSANAAATRGWYWEARAEGSNTWSTDATAEKLGLTLRADVYSSPFLGGVRLFGVAQGDLTFYDSALAPNGDKREDQRLRLTAGLDLTELVDSKASGLRLTIGGQFQRRWSNDPAQEHSRGYFVPNIGLNVPLGG